MSQGALVGAVFIVAGNEHEARQFAERMELRRRQWVYLDGVHRIHGHKERPFILVGSYRQRPDFLQVEQTLLLHNCRQVSQEFIHRICRR